MPGDTWDFFLSHVQKETGAEVTDLYHILMHEFHKKVWLDVKMDKTTFQSMEHGIKHSRVMISVFSESYPTSAACRKEMWWAQEHETPVIPVIPSTMKDHIGRLLAKLPISLRGIGTFEFIPLERSKEHRLLVGVRDVLQRAEKGNCDVVRRPRQSVADRAGIEDASLTERATESLQRINVPKFLEDLQLVSDALRTIGRLELRQVDGRYKNLNDEYIPEDGYFPLNVEYPGVQAIHAKPWIFVVNNFLSDEDCGALLSKCYGGAMEPTLVANDDGEVRTDESQRKCSAVMIPHRETPGVIAKLAKLFGKTSDHFEACSLVKYEAGDFYMNHSDHAPRSEGDGFCSLGLAPSAHRVATCFVYVNDVEKGGATHFTGLDLSVQPKKGQALVFFPGKIDGDADERLNHEAQVADDVKVILTTWMWSEPASYEPSLSSHQAVYDMVNNVLV
ncbi:hypothetical protein AB1Y20_011124 [Prymnesium parvum]|uniref:Fe2OG dioxygenase domain-containing protein n=1 Tax=Prymnesium parvum TaxID=97485 RepID=A0AB34INP2_PRYPA